MSQTTRDYVDAQATRARQDPRAVTIRPEEDGYRAHLHDDVRADDQRPKRRKQRRRGSPFHFTTVRPRNGQTSPQDERPVCLYRAGGWAVNRAAPPPDAHPAIVRQPSEPTTKAPEPRRICRGRHLPCCGASDVSRGHLRLRAWATLGSGRYANQTTQHQGHRHPSYPTPRGNALEVIFFSPSWADQSGSGCSVALATTTPLVMRLGWG